MNEGFEALDSFDADKAIKIGKKLKKLRHSSAFEILALLDITKTIILKNLLKF